MMQKALLASSVKGPACIVKSDEAAFSSAMKQQKWILLMEDAMFGAINVCCIDPDLMNIKVHSLFRWKHNDTVPREEENLITEPVRALSKMLCRRPLLNSNEKTKTWQEELRCTDEQMRQADGVNSAVLLRRQINTDKPRVGSSITTQSQTCHYVNMNNVEQSVMRRN